MTKFYRGIAGKRPGKAKGWVFHNDAGSANATASFYRGWLPNHQAESGFAHDYIGIDGVYNAESYSNMAWHTASYEGNTWYLGVEKCQSKGDEKTFLQIEQKTYQHVAKWYKAEGITPNRSNVRLHHEFTPTSCPHRTMALHGKSTNAVKDYIIAELIKAITGYVPPKTETPSKPAIKDWSSKYYTSNPGRVELLKDDGLFGINDVNFKGGYVGGTYKKGTSFVIVGIKTRADGLPRLVTASGFLLSANKTIVKKVGTSTGSVSSNVVPTSRWITKKGTAKLNTAIRLRGTTKGDYATPLNLAQLTLLHSGESVIYDKILVQKNGHVWVRQPRGNGYGWLPVAETVNGKVSKGYWVSGVSI